MVISKHRLLVFLFSVGLIACIPSTVSTPISSTTVPSMLLRATRTGGLCPYGACYTELIINMDGSFSLRQGEQVTESGVFETPQVTELVGLIEATDFQLLRTHEFTGLCPTAYDGSELAYTFYTSKGLESLDTCQIEIDSTLPPFSTISQIIDELLSHE